MEKTTNLITIGEQLRSLLAPGRGQRPGRPTVAAWCIQRKIPLSSSTLTYLELLSEQISDNRRRVSPMQLAAFLLERAIVECTEKRSEGNH